MLCVACCAYVYGFAYILPAQLYNDSFTPVGGRVSKETVEIMASLSELKRTALQLSVFLGIMLHVNTVLPMS